MSIWERFVTKEDNSDQEIKLTNTRDIAVAISEGHLAEAEARIDELMQNPTESHDERWATNLRLSLYRAYEKKADESGMSRILEKLPENVQLAFQREKPTDD